MNNNALTRKPTINTPAALDQLAKSFMSAALSPSTKRLYQSDWKLFTQWCDTNGFVSLTASAETVAYFLSAEASRGTKPATLVRRLAAIKLAHESAGIDSPTQHKVIRAVLKGIRREKGAAPKKKAPATAERIASMIAYCNTDTLVSSARTPKSVESGFEGFS